MNTAKRNAVAAFAFSMLPYLLISWGYTEFTNGDAKTFWTALAFLYCVRLFFSITEALADTLFWHFYQKKIAVTRAANVLRVNEFPMRKYQHDNFSNYLCRLQEGDDYAIYPQSVKSSAIWIERELVLLEELTVWPAARMWSAWEAALDIYAPRDAALKVLS